MPQPRLAVVADVLDPDVAAAAHRWLDDAPTNYLLCRNDHRFPRLVARDGKLPRGIKVRTITAGSYQVRQRCPDCGTVRVFTYSRGTDLLSASRHYHYEWPDGYRWPKGAASYISVDDVRRTAYDREDAAELIEAAAEPAPEG